jgi:hypothetical protein
VGEIQWPTAASDNPATYFVVSKAEALDVTQMSN